MDIKSIPAKITGHKPVFNERSLYFFCQKNNGKECDLVVRTKERSLSQLGMYRVWLSHVASDTGNDDEALHEYLLDKCAPAVVVDIHGPKGTVQITKKKRTSGGHSLSMNKHEMGEFMEKVAILTGHPLPTPEELQALGYLPT
jgi:hypothetical protein